MVTLSYLPLAVDTLRQSPYITYHWLWTPSDSHLKLPTTDCGHPLTVTLYYLPLTVDTLRQSP